MTDNLELARETDEYLRQWGPFDRELFTNDIQNYIEATNELAQLFKTEYSGMYRGKLKPVKEMDLSKKTDAQLIKLHKYFIDSL